MGPSLDTLNKVIANCDNQGFAVAFCDRKIVQYFNSGRTCLIDTITIFSSNQIFFFEKKEYLSQLFYIFVASKSLMYDRQAICKIYVADFHNL